MATESSSLSQQQTSPGANQGQSTTSGGASHAGQIVQISANQNQEGAGTADMLTASGGKGSRQGLQQHQPQTGNGFIQGSFGNLTINGMAPSMQAAANNMGQHAMTQLGAHLASSSNASGGNSMPQNGMGSMPSMGMNMNAAMSRMANAFQHQQ